MSLKFNLHTDAPVVCGVRCLWDLTTLTEPQANYFCERCAVNAQPHSCISKPCFLGPSSLTVLHQQWHWWINARAERWTGAPLKPWQSACELFFSELQVGQSSPRRWCCSRIIRSYFRGFLGPRRCSTVLRSHVDAMAQGRAYSTPARGLLHNVGEHCHSAHGAAWCGLTQGRRQRSQHLVLKIPSVQQHRFEATAALENNGHQKTWNTF